MTKTSFDNWDAPKAIAAAELYLAHDAPPITRDQHGPRALKAVALQLLRYGVAQNTAIQMIHKQFPDVPLKLIRPKIQRAYADHRTDAGAEAATEDDDDRFLLNHFGKPKTNSQRNVNIALARFGVTLRWDEFQSKAFIEGLDGFSTRLGDESVRRIRFRMEKECGFLPEKDFLHECLLDIARQAVFNPAKEYFDRVESEWDSNPRLNRLLIDYAGADDTPFNRAVGSLMMLAVVRRVREPGAKFDEMVVLESTQGKNKSEGLRILAIRDDWFTDSLPLDGDGREILEHVNGKLIVEVAELQGMRKAEVEHVKAVLSQSVDRGRPVYGRHQIERPRQYIFVGTSNSNRYLVDETGNRRFWPVAIKSFDLDRLARDLPQLWGEAAAYESVGASIRLDPALYAAAAEQQRARLAIHSDPFTEALREHLRGREGRITNEAVWRILGADDAGRRTPQQGARLAQAMKAIGWKSTRFKRGGGAIRGYAYGFDARYLTVDRLADHSIIVEYEDEDCE